MGDERDDIMTAIEAANYLQRDLRTIYRWCRVGMMPGTKVVGRWRFSKAEIDAWLASQPRGRLREMVGRA
jgi:excisionase family DNA binding protein